MTNVRKFTPVNGYLAHYTRAWRLFSLGLAFKKYMPKSTNRSSQMILRHALLLGVLSCVFSLATFAASKQSFPPPNDSITNRIQASFHGDLKQLRERRLIRVLVSHTKTNFFITPKGFRGVEYDLLKAYENYLNRGPRKQRYKTHLMFIPLPFGKLLPNLQEGFGDIAASGLTVTPERLQLVDFTDPYITNVEEVLVSHVNAPRIEKMEDLSGKQVAVVNNSSYIIHLELMNQTLGKLGLEPIELVKVDPLLESEDILELVNERIYDYTVVDNHIALIWQKVLENIRVDEDIVFHHNSQIAWAIQKNTPQLKKSLNQFIQMHAKPGRLLGNSVYKKYFENTYWIERPLTHDLLKRVRCLSYYFQIYSDFYGFDWKLIAAQGYQESRFNQSLKSHAGAVGIMQIKPSTAKDKNVNIPNVHKLEDNIHAGIKYMAFLRDFYFSNDNYTEEERINFTLAAYNAGPSRIRRLQRTAEAKGYNPYVWFYNVETQARNHIGLETVNYVANIRKMQIFLKASRTLDENRRLLLERTVQDSNKRLIEFEKHEAEAQTLAEEAKPDDKP